MTSAVVTLPKTQRTGLHSARLVAYVVLAYVVFFALTRGLAWLLFDVAAIHQTTVARDRELAFGLLFVAAAAPFLYLFNAAVGGAWPRPLPRRLALWMSATFLWGVLLEIGIDSLFQWSLGRLCWEYRIWPRHGGFTSGEVMFMWPLYGAHLCMFHDALARRRLLPKGRLGRSVIMATDAMFMEILANTFSLWLFQSYYFYYLAPDLAHFTTAEIFLPYVLWSTLLATTVSRTQGARRVAPWCIVFAGVATLLLFA